MDLVAALVLAFSTNIDNFAVGLAYRVKQISIGFRANLLIALLSGMSTFASMAFGNWIQSFFAPSLTHKVGSIVLIIIGLVTLIEIIRQNTQVKTFAMNTESQYYLSWQEALLLGLALTITNFGTGVGAGIAQLDSTLTSSFSFISSLLMVGSGSVIGGLLARFSSRLKWVSGIILISLGLYEYILA